MLNDVVLLPNMPELCTTKRGLAEIDEVVGPGAILFGTIFAKIILYFY